MPIPFIEELKSLHVFVLAAFGAGGGYVAVKTATSTNTADVKELKKITSVLKDETVALKAATALLEKQNAQLALTMQQNRKEVLAKFVNTATGKDVFMSVDGHEYVVASCQREQAAKFNRIFEDAKKDRQENREALDKHDKKIDDITERIIRIDTLLTVEKEPQQVSHDSSR